MATSPPCAAVTTITLEDDTSTPRSYRVGVKGEAAWATPARNDLVPTAESLITASLGDQLSGRYLLFHAGGIAGRKGACLLPAPSASGKSTLVAALLAKGFTCLGDDIVIYDDQTGRCLPFVKSIALKAGSSKVLEPIYGRLLPAPTAARFGETPVAFLTPPPETWPSEPLAIRLVAFPVRRPGETARLELLSRADALPPLLSQCFNHQRLGARAVHAAVRLLRDIDAGVLFYDDLREALALLERLLH